MLVLGSVLIQVPCVKHVFIPNHPIPFLWLTGDIVRDASVQTRAQVRERWSDTTCFVWILQILMELLCVCSYFRIQLKHNKHVYIIHLSTFPHVFFRKKRTLIPSSLSFHPLQQHSKRKVYLMISPLPTLPRCHSMAWHLGSTPASYANGNGIYGIGIVHDIHLQCQRGGTCCWHVGCRSCDENWNVRWCVQIFWNYLHPDLWGKWPNLTSIFSDGLKPPPRETDGMIWEVFVCWSWISGGKRDGQILLGANKRTTYECMPLF